MQVHGRQTNPRKMKGTETTLELWERRSRSTLKTARHLSKHASFAFQWVIRFRVVIESLSSSKILRTIDVSQSNKVYHIPKPFITIKTHRITRFNNRTNRNERQMKGSRTALRPRVSCQGCDAEGGHTMLSNPSFTSVFEIAKSR